MIITLRPNAAGDETNLDRQTPITGFHWDKVNEVVANDSTAVWLDSPATTATWERDFYKLPSVSNIDGPITQIKVYVRALSSGNNSIQTNLKIAIKTNSTAVEDIETTLTTTWTVYSKIWTLNPVTGLVWTKDDLNSLQIGAALRQWTDGLTVLSSFVSQVYVEVSVPNIATIKSDIASSVQSVLGIQCYTGFPSAFTPPCAFVMTGGAPYNVNIPLTKIERTFEVTLVVARAEALEDAQAKVEAYLMPTGTSSMQAAIMAAVVSPDGDFIRPVEDTGVIPLTINQTEYIGCRWRAKVMI